MARKNVIIIGAAGRDFHNFNMYFRDNKEYDVKAFTAAQIPDIDGRMYPSELSGKLYPKGIKIYPEDELGKLIDTLKIDIAVFSYSDLPHEKVMHKAAFVNSHDADFLLIGSKKTMVKSSKPVVSVCAVRTGCGKSQTTRQVCRILMGIGKKVVAVRHPMPYGDLSKQAVQRFAEYDDFEKHNCTIEEREEYEPLVAQGVVVYAGVDYEAILRQAEKEADVVIWDGGNNDTPFFAPDVQIVIFDPHRAGHESTYYPGETNMLMADIAVINKIDSAEIENIKAVKENIGKNNPGADIILAESELIVADKEAVKGKRVLIVEDGPTLTHGEMKYGAGTVAAKRLGAAEIVDPRPFIAGSIKDTFAAYPDIGELLPAMGYGDQQVKDLEETINNVDCDLVVFATPIDLPRLITINKPHVRVEYEYKDNKEPLLAKVLLMKLGI